jgi:hypothetical protein
MIIGISNLTIAANANKGTVVGVLSAQQPPGTVITCAYTIVTGGDLFEISGSNLVTRVTPILAGHYSVGINGTSASPVDSGNAIFPVTVTAATIPPIQSLANGTYNFASGSDSVDGGHGYWGATPYVQIYPTNTGTGQQWVWDGSKLSNVLVASGGGQITGAFMADANDGTVTENATGDTWTIKASGGGYTILNDRTNEYLSLVSNVLAMSATQTVWATSAVVAGATPSDITFSPESAQIPPTSPIGTLVTTIGVVMSDGSAFTGTLSVSGSPLFRISGSILVTAQALTSADQGDHSLKITADQGGKSISAVISAVI